VGEFKLETKDIWNAVILISIGIIITMGGIILNEYYGAKNSCENYGGEFSFKFPNNYYCDTIPFYKYTDGWDYEREINFSGLKFP